jgi:RNA polymerase sigma-70 factor (ECF subfamily)
MTAEANFHDLIRRVRAGDERAAAELVRRYEPAIRRAVRVRLTDARTRRVLDSMDVCQSVLGSFFVRAATGQYDLESPERLVRLLTAMARHKLCDAVDHEQADCRDNRRVDAGRVEEAAVPAVEATPSRHASARELLDEARRRLAGDERYLLELRDQGLRWEEIARRVGGGPEALRKKLARAVERVAGELGIDGAAHGGPR